MVDKLLLQFKKEAQHDNNLTRSLRVNPTRVLNEARYCQLLVYLSLFVGWFALFVIILARNALVLSFITGFEHVYDSDARRKFAYYVVAAFILFCLQIGLLIYFILTI
jgi:hypothetical protein